MRISDWSSDVCSSDLIGFARYKNLAAYCAVAVKAEVERETGRVRVARAAAVDSGEIVNPDGIRNQTEGGILQAISRSEERRVGKEGVRTASSRLSPDH